jgi:protein-S-isoprenylcysteine O-methyltransferase Ste14
MLFDQGYASSLPQKRFAISILAIIVLLGGWLMFGSSPVVDGDLSRLIVLFICSLVYLARLSVTFFVFLKRRLSWQETSTITIFVALVISLFLFIGGNQAQALGIIDYLGLVLFGSGSFINTYSEFQRYKWKQKPQNAGLLYTQGLFKYTRHINYFGDIILFSGFAILASNFFLIVIPLLIIINFVFFYIPAMDHYLANKYGRSFIEYGQKTRKLVPGIY